MKCNFILVVEDDPDLRETTRDILELEGFRASTAENGEEALKVLQEMKLPCLILLDLMMPVMDGWEFLEAFKNEHKDLFGKIPVVVVSAVADLTGVQQEYRCHVMNKPADVQQLVSLARQYC